LGVSDQLQLPAGVPVFDLPVFSRAGGDAVRGVGSRGGMAAVAAGGGGRGALLLYLSHAFAFAA